jgi:hypothetical protein
MGPTRGRDFVCPLDARIFMPPIPIFRAQRRRFCVLAGRLFLVIFFSVFLYFFAVSVMLCGWGCAVVWMGFMFCLLAGLLF